MKKPQLLAPAGSLEKLKWAATYGADAVYFGTTFGSLRSFAGNLTLAEAETGIKFLHAQNKKAFVTLNIYPFTDEYDKLLQTAKDLDALNVDALIVADLGLISLLKKENIKAPIHVSTQANTTSYQTALAYKPLGASRVNLARELSIDQIEQITQKLQNEIETEVFIHGSVCFSYSGRCAISDYLTGHRANRGECKHPCRWKYSLVEEKRPGEYIPVFEDDRGLYLFNSKEIALFQYVDRLAAANVTSLKIEGRMKSIHYIATTVSFYRQVIDGRKFTRDQALELLTRIPNRGYSEGFIKGSITPDDYSVGKSLSAANSIFVANVTARDENNTGTLEVRNKIHAADTLEVLSPDGQLSKIKMPDPLITTSNKELPYANNSQFLKLKNSPPPYSILRKIKSP
jgi:putative protease